MRARMGRTLVERHDNVRTEILLDLHRALWTDECRRTVEVILEVDSLFGDLPQLGQGEDLEAPTVREYWSFPAHELVQTALSGDHLFPGSNVKMIGISKNHLGTQFLKLEG